MHDTAHGQASEASCARIVLFHLKKTAGTSAYRHIRESIKQEISAPWSLDFDRAKFYPVMGGHYGMEEILSVDAIRICFLRDPVGRVISLYNYVQTLSDEEVLRNADPGAIAMRPLSLQACIESTDQAILYDVENCYCKNFFGRDYKREDIFSEDGSLTPKASLIISQIDFFGFQENFDASIYELMSFLGLSQPVRIHREKDINDLTGGSKPALSSEELNSISEKIRLMNSDDVALYNYIRGRKVMKEVNGPNAALGDFPLAEAGRTFQFKGIIDAYANILYDGWYGVEDGVWSKGNVAALALSKGLDAHLILLELEVPAHDRLPRKTITVTINGKIERRIHIIQSSTAIKISQLQLDDSFAALGENGRFLLSIPVEQLSSPVCHVVLSIDTVFVPSKYENTGDDRALGFKLHKLTVL